MKRELSKILTPGTLVDEELLENSNATHLLGIIVTFFILLIESS
jgi:hypothetical protein